MPKNKFTLWVPEGMTEEEYYGEFKPKLTGGLKVVGQVMEGIVKVEKEIGFFLWGVFLYVRGRDDMAERLYNVRRKMEEDDDGE
jgi:hypothetical protein